MPFIMVGEARCQFCSSSSSESQLFAGGVGLICIDCARKCVETSTSDGSAGRSPFASGDEQYVYQRLFRHFAPRSALEMQSTRRSFPLRQQADLQRALDELLGSRIVPQNFVGILSKSHHEEIGYANLLQREYSRAEIAPPMYEEVDIGRGERVRCLKNGLWLLIDGTEPYAVVLSQIERHDGSSIIIDVAVPPGEKGIAITETFFGAIERRLSSDSCYRGRVLSLEQSYPWSGSAQRILIHELETVPREDLILPAETLATIERNVFGFADKRSALRALGLSTQKGLLFHGPPGTGKTHCIRYLAGRLKDHTTLLITAEQVGLLAEYVALARLLQPAIVVVEDADLIARERSRTNSPCEEVMLNRLLNELDGLKEKADVFFILTTNRPSMLEPALVDRPGRIDQAIEFPLPDTALRRRLIALYASGLAISDALAENLAARTQGSSPAFIKELLRRTAQHHLESGRTGEVTRATAEAALDEMLFSGGLLNKRLLGGENVDGSGGSSSGGP